MTFNADTGNGASMTLGTTSFVGQYTELDPGEDKLGALEDSYLATTNRKTYIAEDLVESGEIKGTTQFDTGAAVPTLNGVPETITITFPLRSGQTTPATLAGTGFLQKFSRPKLMNNTIMMSEIEVKWNGKTGPVFTPGS